MNLINLGDETGGAPDYSGADDNYDLPHDANIGDFRIGMHSLPATPPPELAHALYPDGILSVSGSRGGDVHFMSNHLWRLDATAPGIAPNAYSIKNVAVHEFGHSFALGHSSSSLSVMTPFSGWNDNFVSIGSVDKTCLEYTYSNTAGTGGDQLGRCVCIDKCEDASVPSENGDEVIIGDYVDADGNNQIVPHTYVSQKDECFGGVKGCVCPSVSVLRGGL